LACNIEIGKLGHPIGKQDQYAAAFGNLNALTFNKDGVVVERVRISRETRAALQRNLLLFYTGAARDSSTILKEQSSASRRRSRPVIEALHAVKAIAEEMKVALENGELARVGDLLGASWEHKKRFSPGVTNPLVDECYAVACAAGATGGKLTGAGGGGFLMLYCEPQEQPAVTCALEALGLKKMGFSFSQSGARVLMNASLSLFPDVAAFV
jgi:D-glycero-alpha-D-manno-heptose-7-phosphate kinase